MIREECFKILGIAIGSTEADIIAAHKSRAKDCHPDKGGTEEEMSRLNQAKDFLLGKNSAKINDESEIITDCLQFLFADMDELSGRDESFFGYDLLKHLKIELIKQKHVKEADIAKIERKMFVYRGYAHRFFTNKEVNIISKGILARVDYFKEQLCKVKENHNAINRAIKLVDGYAYSESPITRLIK